MAAVWFSKRFPVIMLSYTNCSAWSMLEAGWKIIYNMFEHRFRRIYPLDLNINTQYHPVETEVISNIKDGCYGQGHLMTYGLFDRITILRGN